jgi:hypothetical protein
VPVADSVIANRIGDGGTSMASADTADSPINGLLKRILWQVQNFLNRFPSALGPQTSATSLSTVLSSDHPTISVSGPLTNTELRLNPVAVSGPLTDTQLRASAVSISQEKFRTIETLTWATTGASAYFPITSYPVGTIFRIDGNFNGSTNNRYTLAEGSTTSIPVSSFTSVPLTDWATGTVVSASVGTEGGTFYYRKNNDSTRFLGFKKVSGSAGDNAAATISVYYESDDLNQGRSVVLSKPLTDGQLRASAVKVDQVKTLEFTQITGTAPENPTDILTANTGRNYLLFQNLSEQPIHLSFSGPATTSSLRVDGGGGLVFESGIVPSNAVSILRTATNQSYYLTHA